MFNFTVLFICILQFEPSPLIPDRDVCWQEEMAGAKPVDCVPIGAMDPLYLLYTSGTTGLPKVTCIYFDSMVWYYNEILFSLEKTFLSAYTMHYYYLSMLPYHKLFAFHYHYSFAVQYHHHYLVGYVILLSEVYLLCNKIILLQNIFNLFAIWYCYHNIMCGIVPIQQLTWLLCNTIALQQLTYLLCNTIALYHWFICYVILLPQYTYLLCVTTAKQQLTYCCLTTNNLFIVKCYYYKISLIYLLYDTTTTMHFSYLLYYTTAA